MGFRIFFISSEVISLVEVFCSSHCLGPRCFCRFSSDAPLVTAGFSSCVCQRLCQACSPLLTACRVVLFCWFSMLLFHFLHFFLIFVISSLLLTVVLSCFSFFWFLQYKVRLLTWSFYLDSYSCVFPSEHCFSLVYLSPSIF